MRFEHSMQDFPSTEKYSRHSILNPKKIRKGHTRWNQFDQALREIDPAVLHGPLLDFGFGVGYFVLEGLRRRKNIWGVDMLPGKLERYRKLIEYSGSPAAWAGRCVAGSGEELPFRSDTFSAISSWYVFEHIDDPGPILREIVRITRSGGVIAIRAQDARNGWEGHCKIPWIPFLSPRLAAVWIEEFGAAAELRRGVVDVTQPQLIAILEKLNCTVIKQAPEPSELIAGHWNLTTAEEVRALARRTRLEYETGRWQPQPENLYLFARKG